MVKLLNRTGSQNVVRKLAKQNLKTNKAGNVFIVIAISLTTFLLATIFNIGLSYYHSLDIQQMKLMGTKAHSGLSRPTEEQILKILSLDYIQDIGLLYDIGTVDVENCLVSLVWYDESEWNNFRLPAYDNITGKYPDTSHEIMTSTWALKEMGIEDPYIGMDIPLSCTINQKKYNGVFTLSGYFDSYLHIRSKNQDYVIVSQDFMDEYGYNTQENAALSILYKDERHILEYNQQLERDITLQDSQSIRAVPRYSVDKEAQRKNVLVLVFMITFIVIMSFLLIYNILNLSMEKSIRFLGLLKVVGMSSGDMKKYNYIQLVYLCIIGIPIGLICSVLVSLTFLPVIIKQLANLQTGIELSSSPVIYIAACIFAFFTVWLAGTHSTKIALNVSPIDAIKYLDHNEKNAGNSSICSSLIRFSWKNVFRQKKRTLLVFASLVLGICGFTITISLVKSIDIDKYVMKNYESDFKIVTENEDEFQDIIAQTEVENLQRTYIEYMQINYDNVIFDRYVLGMDKEFSPLTDDYIVNNFKGYLIGLDDVAIKALIEKYNLDCDLAGFKEKGIALVGIDNKEHFSKGSITISILKDDVSDRTFTVSLIDCIPSNYKWNGQGVAPNIYVSNSFLQQILDTPTLYAIQFDVDDEVEKNIYSTLQERIREQNTGVLLQSRLGAIDELKETKLIISILGFGIAGLLCLVGILNFINIISVSILTRTHEMAIMESVGLTHKQAERMLKYEGLIYALVSWLMSIIAGVPICFAIYFLLDLDEKYGALKMPYLEWIVILVTLMVLCISIPIIFYKHSKRQSVVERLRIPE